MRHWLQVQPMPESLRIHEPLFVNTVGHACGSVLFALLLLLLFTDSRRRHVPAPGLAAAAAAAALVWNVGSLLALSPLAGDPFVASMAAAVSFAGLSVLPALLLSIALKGRDRVLRVCGWCASGAAVLLHIAEPFAGTVDLHRVALLLIAAVFAALAVISILSSKAHTDRKRMASGVLVPMALILFAGSFVHFSDAHSNHPWSEEVAIHHAGVPLALFIVLQEYRFLMLDAFVRVLASSGLAATFTLLCLIANARWHLMQRASDPFVAGLLVTGTGFLLILFAFARGFLQRWITQRVFARPRLEDAIGTLTEAPAFGSEADLLKRAALIISDHFGAERIELRDGGPADKAALLPQLVNANNPPTESWVEAIVPLQFSRGDSTLLLLGRRAGGRRYLSEDLRDLSQLALVVTGQVERYRSERAEHLATEAELRALRAQINPHFLFNSLNALYGTIPRQAEEARRMVLNLADVFRYFLQSERSTIPLREELRIVRAYLDIEQLRLGDRLRITVDADARVLDVPVPPLCIQPIVENGIKHGVAAVSGPGAISIYIAQIPGGVQVRVHDSGPGFGKDSTNKGHGIGLDNVRQRLSMLYGRSSDVEVHSDASGTTVSFVLPSTTPANGSEPSRLPEYSAR